MTTSDHQPALATFNQVTNALSSLGLEATPEAIARIRKHCREEFLGMLQSSLNNRDDNDPGRDAIKNLLRALSPALEKQVKEIVPNVPTDLLIEAALKRPKALFAAIELATTSGHPRESEARAFLRSLLGYNSVETGNGTQEAVPDETIAGQRKQPSDPATPLGPRSANYLCHHVYGSNYALTFNATDWNGAPGVMVDAAAANKAKTYDWKQAIHIWLNINEVGALLAVFRRWRPSVEFKSHGASMDKSFSLELQDRHFFAKVTAKKASTNPVRGVQIRREDATAVSLLLLTLLQRSYPAIPLSELLATVRATQLEADVMARDTNTPATNQPG